MGNVVNGKHQLSASTWYMFPAQADILGWCPSFYYSSQLLVMKNQPNGFDLGLYLRPFNKPAWIAILIMAMIVFTLWQLQLNGWAAQLNQSNGFIIAETSGWYFFLVMYAFYGGVLTSYFASRSDIKFTSIFDVINAYPGKNSYIFELN